MIIVEKQIEVNKIGQNNPLFLTVCSLNHWWYLTAKNKGCSQLLF